MLLAGKHFLLHRNSASIYALYVNTIHISVIHNILYFTTMSGQPCKDNNLV